MDRDSAFPFFRTGDDPINGFVPVLLRVPSVLWYRAALADAILMMSEDRYWAQWGTVTVEDAINAGAQVFQTMTSILGWVIPYVTASAPDGTLACDGTQYLRADYPDLYDVLDAAFIVDADHFIVPNLNDRVIVGASATKAVGSTGGEETHTLTSTEMPNHAHSDTGHIHTTGNSLTGLALAPGELPVLIPNPLPAITGTGYAGITATGGSGAHNNMQPYVALKYAVVAK